MTHFTTSHIDAMAEAVIHSVCYDEVKAALLTGIGKARIAHAAYFDVLFKRLAPYERRWKTMLWKIWAEEQAILLANLKKLKKAQRRKGFSDNVMYPQAPFKEKLSKETKKILAAMLDDLGQEKLDELDLGMNFDVTNPNVKRWLADYSFKFSEELEAVNSERLRRILDEGMEAGKSIPELMTEVKQCFDSMDRYRAEIISRTETSRASNKAAMEAYKQSGVVEKKQWLTAPDCCDACKVLDGDVIPLEDDFKSAEFDDTDAPPLHPNCVLPGTFCETPGGLVLGLRAWYSGQAIELTFANGRRLSVTKNHLLLTPNGFAPAYLLREGDDVFYCPDAEGVIPVNPNDDGKPALVEKIVSALTESGGMAISRVPLTPEYLHGDGRFCNGDIDVIGPNGLLHDAEKTSLTKGIGALPLNVANGDLVNLSRQGALALLFKRLADTADSIVGGLRQSHPFFLARLAHADEHRGTTPTGIDVGIKQTSADDAPRNPEMGGQEFLGMTGQIHLADQAIGNRSAMQEIKASFPGSELNPGLSQSTTDAFSMKANPLRNALMGETGLIQTTKVIDVKVFPYSGHVYDLQTIASLYICNSILSSNCRCAVAAYIE